MATLCGLGRLGFWICCLTKTFCVHHRCVHRVQYVVHCGYNVPLCSPWAPTTVLATSTLEPARAVALLCADITDAHPPHRNKHQWLLWSKSEPRPHPHPPLYRRSTSPPPLLYICVSFPRAGRAVRPRWFCRGVRRKVALRTEGQAVERGHGRQGWRHGLVV